MTNIFSISLVTVQYFFPPRTYNFTFSTHCYILYLVLPLLVLLQYCTLFSCQSHLLRLNDEFDGIWTSCGLRPRFRCGDGGFGFYNHSDIVIKMVLSQGGHIKRRLLYMYTNHVTRQSKAILIRQGNFMYQMSILIFDFLYRKY